MSQLFDQVRKLKFDKRLIALNLKNGELTKTEYEKYLQGLTDCAERAKTVKVTAVTGNDSVN